MRSSVPSAERNHRRRSEPANSEKKGRNIFPNRESSQKINGLSRFARDLTRPVGGMLHPINDLVVQRPLNRFVSSRSSWESRAIIATQKLHPHAPFQPRSIQFKPHAPVTG